MEFFYTTHDKEKPVEHGPFSEVEMLRWFRESMLPSHLVVTCLEAPPPAGKAMRPPPQRVLYQETIGELVARNGAAVPFLPPLVEGKAEEKTAEKCKTCARKSPVFPECSCGCGADSIVWLYDENNRRYNALWNAEDYIAIHQEPKDSRHHIELWMSMIQRPLLDCDIKSTQKEFMRNCDTYVREAVVVFLAQATDPQWKKVAQWIANELGEELLSITCAHMDRSIRHIRYRVYEMAKPGGARLDGVRVFRHRQYALAKLFASTGPSGELVAEYVGRLSAGLAADMALQPRPAIPHPLLGSLRHSRFMSPPHHSEDPASLVLIQDDLVMWLLPLLPVNYSAVSPAIRKYAQLIVNGNGKIARVVREMLYSAGIDNAHPHMCQFNSHPECDAARALGWRAGDRCAYAAQPATLLHIAHIKGKSGIFARIKLDNDSYLDSQDKGETVVKIESLTMCT